MQNEKELKNKFCWKTKGPITSKVPLLLTIKNCLKKFLFHASTFRRERVWRNFLCKCNKYIVKTEYMKIYWRTIHERMSNCGYTIL